MISIHLTAHLLLIIFSLLLIFHLCILAGILPKDIVWAGKIKDRNELVKMEAVSLLVLAIAITIVALKIGYLSFFKNPTAIHIGLWMLFVFFILNTLGNLTAKNPIEKYGFGLLTALIALLILRLVII